MAKKPYFGRRIVNIRLDEADLVAMNATIARRNYYSPDAAWTRSDFIVAAIREKIAKMKRSRSSSRKKKEVPDTHNA